MPSKLSILISVPKPEGAERYFSVKLKDSIKNESSEFAMPPKIFVISDINGNFRELCVLLIKQHIINRQLHWTFDDGHLVILGDCMDLNGLDLECLWLIYSLEEQAKKTGGYVHFLLGDNEIKNLNSGWNFSHPRYAIPSSKHLLRGNIALYDGNNELYRWLSSKNVALKIGDTLFVHGGISETLLHFNLSLTDINNISRQLHFTKNLSIVHTDQLNLFSGEQSPIFFNSLDHPNRKLLIYNTLKYFDVNRIINSHNKKDQTTSEYEGTAIAISSLDRPKFARAILIEGSTLYQIIGSRKLTL